MTADQSPLREHLQVLVRRKWIAIAGIVVVPVIAVVLAALQTPLYAASAQVLLNRQNLANSLNNVTDPTSSVDPQRLVQTQADIARSPRVAARVVRAAGLPGETAAQFLGSSSVSGQSDADLLVFSVTDRKPDVATKLVNLDAAAYVHYAGQLATQAIRTARKSVAARLHTLTTHGDRQSNVYRDLVDKDQQLATMEALETSNAVLVQSANGASQVAPRPLRNGLIGLLIGIVLGIGAAFLRDHLDTRVRHAEEVSERLGLPILARVPEPPRRLEGDLVMVAEPTGTAAEPFRVLRTNLEFVAQERKPRTIMITSARGGEGKSTTASNLAVAMASVGQRVALVDLDLRRPTLHELFDFASMARSAPYGITDVALGHATLDEALVSIRVHAAAGGAWRKVLQRPARSNGHEEEPDLTSLHVLGSGPLPPNPGEFVRSPAIKQVLDRLAAAHDAVIVDCVPLLGVGDALALTDRVDAVIVVARLELLRQPMLDELKRLLDGSPASPLGIVVTAAERERTYGYGYGDDYGYPSGNGQAKVVERIFQRRPARQEAPSR